MFKPFLTIQNIAIAVLIAVIGYFIWNYTRMDEKIVSLESELAIANEAVVLANQNVNKCYTEMKDVQDDYNELQEDFNLIFVEGLDAVEDICTRRDTLGNINSPEDVQTLEDSLNERFNRRNF